jgi:hypothetical protein
MTATEFNDLHANCVTAMQSYLVEVEKTSTMLRFCTEMPLSFRARLKLMRQQLRESNSHETLVGLKHRLFIAARLGYRFAT